MPLNFFIIYSYAVLAFDMDELTELLIRYIISGSRSGCGDGESGWWLQHYLTCRGIDSLKFQFQSYQFFIRSVRFFSVLYIFACFQQ